MKQRGRKSSNHIQVVGSLEVSQRAVPTPSLTEDEKVVWLQVVNSVDADWFGPETLPLLELYCKHVCASRILARKLDAMHPDSLTMAADADPVLAEQAWADQYDRLLRMRDRESRAALAMARSMRLTQQAQVHRDTAGNMKRDSKAAGKKLWEDA